MNDRRDSRRCLRSGATCSLVALFMGLALMPADAKPRHRLDNTFERGPTVVDAPTSYRGLTINREPSIGPDEDDYSAGLDRSLRYGSIRTFNPVPYVDSGRQYPFGLDGIGGYGTDLGAQGAADTALYDRGP